MANTEFGFSIAVTGIQDLVYDGARDYLYITTSTGDLQRYDVGTKALLESWHVGSSLNGADITADAAFLCVAEGARGALEGLVHKVDLTTGQVTNLAYTLTDNYAVGSYDVAIGSDGFAFVTGTQGNPLRKLDLATGIFSLVEPYPWSLAYNGPFVVERSLDANWMVFPGLSSYDSGLYTYDVSGDTFAAETDLGNYASDRLALNADGSLIVVQIDNEIKIFDAGLNLVAALPFATGISFDPTRDVLYLSNAATDELAAYDATDFSFLYRLNIGADAISHSFHSLVVADDGQYAFIDIEAGVRALKLPEVGTPENDSLAGSSAADFLLALAGDDAIASMAGGDRADGGAGEDTLDGAAGRDSLIGGSGNDLLLGGPGADTLAGGAGNDTLRGDAGWDSISGGAGHDQLVGDLGNDTLVGGDGRDVLAGGEGDSLSGGNGPDIVNVDAFSFYAVDGGAGIDKLQFTGSGLDADLRLFEDGRISGIEVLDIRGSGPNAVTAGRDDVMSMSSTTDLLVVHGDGDDTLVLAGAWEVLELDGYDLYSLDAASVLVSTSMSVEFIGA
jgi:Ca2+-binding RTX toxin-like protein